jgi:hypothetical protein
VFPLRSISIRGRRSFLIRGFPRTAPRRCLRCSPGPSRPDPPRCCVALQRLTVRRSHSNGFAAPPTSLCLSTWTMACSAEPPPGRLPFQLDTAPGLSLTLEDLVRVPVRAASLTYGGQSFVAFLLPWGSSPLRRSQSGESTSRRGVFPRPPPVGFRLQWVTGRAVAAHTVTVPPCLVAGFHPRFGPPSPFLTTMTVCSSPGPVAYFGHSRP